ncbi:hypothetical protein AB837_00010 [bacterium AB1]|nr:hypothetical protein AB837_00010 [bacterium AB1]
MNFFNQVCNKDNIHMYVDNKFLQLQNVNNVDNRMFFLENVKKYKSLFIDNLYKLIQTIFSEQNVISIMHIEIIYQCLIKEYLYIMSILINDQKELFIEKFNNLIIFINNLNNYFYKELIQNLYNKENSTFLINSFKNHEANILIITICFLYKIINLHINIQYKYDDACFFIISKLYNDQNSIVLNQYSNCDIISFCNIFLEYVYFNVYNRSFNDQDREKIYQLCTKYSTIEEQDINNLINIFVKIINKLYLYKKIV